MIISENNARIVADHQQEILFKTYSYQNGKDRRQYITGRIVWRSPWMPVRYQLMRITMKK